MEAARILLLYFLWIVKGNKKGWSKGSENLYIFSWENTGHIREGKSKVFLNQKNRRKYIK